MMTKNQVLSALLLALTIGSAAAGESSGETNDASRALRLSLSEARARARDASPELSAARDAVAAARGEERQAGAFLNPSVAWSREQTSQSGDTNSQDIVLFEQPLEIAGQRGLRRDAASAGREAAEARLAVAELDLDLDVAQAFAETLAAERKATRAREAADAFARARKISEERRERGDVSGYEARRTALEAARYAALEAAAEAGITIVGLNQVIGDDFTTADPQTPALAASVMEPPLQRGERIGRLVLQACEGLTSATWSTSTASRASPLTWP